MFKLRIIPYFIIVIFFLFNVLAYKDHCWTVGIVQAPYYFFLVHTWPGRMGSKCYPKQKYKNVALKFYPKTIFFNKKIEKFG